MPLDRQDLPQIPHDQLDKFKSYLKENGIRVLEGKIPLKLLSPIQKNINIEKVNNIKKSLYKINNPIIISEDGKILDGHHRFIAEKEENPDGKILCMICRCPITKLVELGHTFPGSEVKTIHETKKLEDTEPIELMVRKLLWHPE